MCNRYAPSARWLVRLHFGQTVIPTRTFETYSRARAYAGTLRRASVRRASVRPILTDREYAWLYLLGCTVMIFVLNAAMGG